MRTATGFLPLVIVLALLTANTLGQTLHNPSDITGWERVPWGTAKPVALKTLRPLAAHECNPAKISCANAAGTETLVIDRYLLDAIPFRVSLVFGKNGLSKTIMTGEDQHEAFEKTLALLTTRYGKPGLQSEYDGETEQTYTTWVWMKPHGKLSMEAEEASGSFRIRYEAVR